MGAAQQRGHAVPIPLNPNLGAKPKPDPLFGKTDLPDDLESQSNEEILFLFGRANEKLFTALEGFQNVFFQNGLIMSREGVAHLQKLRLEANQSLEMPELNAVAVAMNSWQRVRDVALGRGLNLFEPPSKNLERPRLGGLEPDQSLLDATTVAEPERTTQGGGEDWAAIRQLWTKH